MKSLCNLLLYMAASLLLLNGAAITVSAVDFSPRTHARFNNPYGTSAEKRAIVSYIIKTIHAAPTGSTIRIAAFGISDDNFVEALLTAKNRGVNVKVLVNKAAQPSKWDQMLINGLGSNRTARSYITWCNTSCMSTAPGSIMHAKLYLFSQSGSSKYISMTGSGNPSIHNIYGSWNDLFINANESTLYNANVRYFNDMLAEKDNPNYFWSQRSGDYAMNYFPRDPSLQNYYLAALNKVKCTGASTGYGYNGRTVIRVNMYFWGNDMLNAATKLQQLDAAGCEVQIILNNSDYHLGSKILAALHKPSTAYGKISVYDTATKKAKTHEKYLLINGVYDGNSAKKIVFTGSANWTQNSQTQDNDTVLRIDNDAVYDKYFRQFLLIKTKYATFVN